MYIPRQVVKIQLSQTNFQATNNQEEIIMTTLNTAHAEVATPAAVVAKAKTAPKTATKAKAAAKTAKTAPKTAKTAKTAPKTSAKVKTAAKAAAKTATKAKTAKTAATKRKATERVRPPAKELMAARKRMFFGAAYMNGVLGGVHRDHAKMLQHALHLKVDQPAKLKAMTLEKLREKLAEAILARPDGATPFSIHLVD